LIGSHVHIATLIRCKAVEAIVYWYFLSASGQVLPRRDWSAALGLPRLIGYGVFSPPLFASYVNFVLILV